MKNKTNRLSKELCRKLVENNIWVSSAKYFWAEQAYGSLLHSRRHYKWDLITGKERPPYCRCFMPAPTKDEVKIFVEAMKEKNLNSDEYFVDNIIKTINHKKK